MRLLRSRLSRLAILLLAPLLLCGCVQYDVGVHFDNPQRGEIVQHIQIADRLRGLSDAAVKQWVETVEQRSRAIGGEVRRLPNQELLVNIPFYNAADLERKFNQFFQVTASDTLPEIASHLSVTHHNLLLLERDRLRYEVDLRSLGVSSSRGNVLVSPSGLLDLQFRLDTPWGARSLTKGNLTADRSTGLLTWKLIPGEVNCLEAAFWLPSPIGIGAAMIGLLVLGGQFFKSSRQPITPTVAIAQSDQDQ